LKIVIDSRPDLDRRHARDIVEKFEVGADRKILAIAGQYDRPDVGVFTERVKGVAKRAQHRRVRSIAALSAGEDDTRDPRFGALDPDIAVSHRSASRLVALSISARLPSSRASC